MHTTVATPRALTTWMVSLRTRSCRGPVHRLEMVAVGVECAQRQSSTGDGAEELLAGSCRTGQGRQVDVWRIRPAPSCDLDAGQACGGHDVGQLSIRLRLRHLTHLVRVIERGAAPQPAS
jgi:hypothetical protein